MRHRRVGMPRAGVPMIGRPGFSYGIGRVVSSIGASTDLDFAKGKYVPGGNPGTSLTFQRGSVAWAPSSSGDWPQFALGVPRITDMGIWVEEPRTNGVRNNIAQGAVPGTPGTVPTNWTINAPANLARQIVGVGVENGIDYIDVRWFGTTNAALGNTPMLVEEVNNSIAAANGQSWTVSRFLKVVAGSLTNISFAQAIGAYTAGGAFVEWILNGAVITPFPSTMPLGMCRIFGTGTTTNATDAFVQPHIWATFGNGVAIDVTLRLGWAQLELGSFVTTAMRCAGSAFSRSGEQIQIAGGPPAGVLTAETLYCEFLFPPGMTAGTNGRVFVDNAPAFDVGSNLDTLILNQTVQPNQMIGGTTLSNTVNAGRIDCGATPAPGTKVKALYAAALNNRSIVANGLVVNNNVGAAARPVNLNNLSLGSNGTTLGAEHINTVVRRIGIWPSKLSDATIQSLSAVAVADAPLFIDFVNNAGTLNGFAPTPGQLMTVNRPSVVYEDDLAGNQPQFGLNVLRRTNKGALIEESRIQLVNNSLSLQDCIPAAPNTAVATTEIPPLYNGATVLKHILNTYTGDSNSGAIGGAGAPSFNAPSTTYIFSCSIWIPSSNTKWSAASFKQEQSAAPWSNATWCNVDMSIRDRWQRVSGQVTTGGAGSAVGNAVFRPVGIASGDFCYSTAWQFEAGPFPNMNMPSSFIGSSASNPTRQRDGVTLLVPATTKGTLVAEFMVPILGRAFHNCVFLTDGVTNQNVIGFYLRQSDSTIRVTVNTASINQVDLAAVATYTPGSVVKCAFAFSAADFAFSVNGASPVTAGAGTIPVWTMLEFANGGANAANGYIRSVAFFPGQRLTNAQLQSLST